VVSSFKQEKVKSLMNKATLSRSAANRTLAKAPTGIQGLDEITGGGFPRGRPTLVCGSAGAGKTLLAMEFLVRGATEHNEPGVFMAFEETAADLTENVRSLGFDLERLTEEKKMVVDYVRVERSEIDETGDYDLEGLFIRLGCAIDAVGAKRVVLDTIENLFSGLQNEGILRAELRRLFHWLKDKGVSAVITAERGEGALTRHGLEEYVSDCVILLDHRVSEQVSTRRLRIVKYRGTTHGTNEYPFLINEDGFSVLPVTSLDLQHQVTSERISSGIARLDAMLGGKGFYQGSTILVSGTAGTGKTSLAAHFIDAACRRGERCLYFSFEESPGQLIRNMRSIGLDLETWVKKGLLEFHSSRPMIHGLEMHLAVIHRLVQRFKPEVVVLDPIGSLIDAGNLRDANIMLIRLIDFLKLQHISAFFTDLISAGKALERSDVRISSLVDTWILMRSIEGEGERNRTLYVLKSRGMSHSNQLREFLLTDQGFDLLEPRRGLYGVLTESSRLSKETREKAIALPRSHGADETKLSQTRKPQAPEAQNTALRKEFEVEEGGTTRRSKGGSRKVLS
jgi:circadian clock protein KaiC